MNMQRLLACSFLVLLSACSAECSCNGGDDDEDGTTTGQGGGTTTGQGGDTGAGGDGQGGGTTTGQGGGGGEGGGGTEGGVPLRVMHLAPDAAAFNVCLVDLESQEETLLLGASGIEFQGYTNHEGVFSGTYDVVLTAPGATDCGTALATLENQTLTLGEARTIAIIGRADADAGDPDELGLAVYDDDLSVPEAGTMHARFIHAAPGAPAVDVGYLEDPEDPASFVALWEGAEYPNDMGYLAIDAFDSLELVARAAGTDAVLLDGIEVFGAEGTIVEGIAVGLAAGAGADVLTITTTPEPAE